MELLTLTFGAIITYVVISQNMFGLMSSLYLLPLRSRTKFESYYKIRDDKLTHYVNKKHLANIGFQKYKKLHAAAQPYAYSLFQKEYNLVLMAVVRKQLVPIAIPLIFFSTYWYLYLAGFLLSIVVLVLKDILLSRMPVDLYRMVAIGGVLKHFVEEVG